MILIIVLLLLKLILFPLIEIKMDYPLHLRPKFRLLSKVMCGKKQLPKRYRHRMTDTYWENIDKKGCFMKSSLCSHDIKKFIDILPTRDGRGDGAFAKCDLKKEQYLGCYLGKIVEDLNEHEISYFPDVAYRFEMPFQDWCVCALNGGNETRFFNHSEKENVGVKGICHDGEYHLGFFLNCDVKQGEELTINYGDGYWNVARRFGIELIDGENNDYREEDNYYSNHYP